MSALSQLRHAYHQLSLGTVRDQKQFADGLIAPAIREMEIAEQYGIPEAKRMVAERDAVLRMALEVLQDCRVNVLNTERMAYLLQEYDPAIDSIRKVLEL